jgi:hypothetical protein
MQRFPFFLALTVAAAFAPTALADTETTDTTNSTSAEAAEAEATQLAEADTDTEAEADSDSQGDPAAAAEGEGTGSGDADAGGPVDAPAPDAAEADDTTKKDGKKAGTVKEELTPDGKKKPKKDLATGEGAPAALAPGGVVGGGSSFPLGITVSTNTSVGAGTFAIGSTNNPSVTSNLQLRPRFVVPKLVDWQPSALITGFMGVNMDWISSQTGGFQTGPRDRQLRISDTSVSLILPALVREPFTGISVTPILTTRIPTSVASRFANRIFGIAPAVLVGWSLPTPIGIAALQYVAAGTYWEHTTNSATIPCGEQLPTGGGFFPGTGFADGVSDIPMHIGRVEEIDANGQCRVQGRQIIATAVNQLTFAYTLPTSWGMHTLSIGGGIFNIITRPLEYKPELRSAFAQPQSFFSTTPLTTSNISYNYAVPGAWVPFGANVQLSAGISAFNSMFDGRGFINPPTDLIFWAPRSTGDAPAGLVLSPSRNNTTGFATLTVGI